MDDIHGTPQPSKIAQLGRRLFNIDIKDDRSAAIETVASLRAYFTAVLHMPDSFKALGIANPDIKQLTANLHANKGPEIGEYYRLRPADTEQIYTLMLASDQQDAAQETSKTMAAE